MLVKLVGSGSELENLTNIVASALSELGLSDFVQVTSTDDSAYKTELGIEKNPALCIEEESIEFRDVIFQGSIPEHGELVSMFSSIFWGTSESSCSSGDGCGSGCSGCSH